MEAKERLAARLKELDQKWNHAETDELVLLARDLYEGLVELRYQEQIAPQPSSRAEPVKTTEREEVAASDHEEFAEPSEETPSPEPPRTQPEHPAAAPPYPSEQRSETPSAEHPSAPPKSKILIDFNDRWAFVNKLFDRNQDDFNRVISQLNTMSTHTEARSFIEHVVKPDYHWADQEEFETRFMELIERHFS